MSLDTKHIDPFPKESGAVSGVVLINVDKGMTEKPFFLCILSSKYLIDAEIV